jgi:hypothetical protein
MPGDAGVVAIYLVCAALAAVAWWRLRRLSAK